ncbi:MAG: outer membrane beta-barrel protein [Flammeovirgaceae bacterium]|nr:outer membrane beta-barrel protein [Flammeovirgaceae bacterium]
MFSFNGWQRIYASGKLLPALGWQVKYQPNKVLFNWSFFIGNVESKGVNQIRFFNNFYLQTNLTKNLTLIADLDWGVQIIIYYGWWGLVHASFNTLFSSAIRAEYYLLAGLLPARF